MARWMKPTKELPECDAGDRVVIIVREREVDTAPLTLRLAILVATEDGWTSDDPTYYGYTPHDGEVWAYERDVCRIADEIKCELWPEFKRP